MSAVAAPTVGATGGSNAAHLITSEYRKIRTTNTWWLFGIGVIVMTGLALLANIATAHYGLTSANAADPQAVQQNPVLASPVSLAAGVFTSGQFFGGMFVMLLAILIVTNEYHHQTATSTFLTTPHRTSVIMAKLATAIVMAAFFWLVTTVLDLISGAIYYSLDGYPSHLGDWPVTQAILLNLMVYALWGVFGVGVGVLIRSQLGATITAALLYVIGTQLVTVIFYLIRQLVIKHDWVLTARVLIPAVAAQVAVSPTQAFEFAPAQWVGIAVLLGYGLIMGGIGIVIMRKRDIS